MVFIIYGEIHSGPKEQLQRCVRGQRKVRQCGSELIRFASEMLRRLRYASLYTDYVSVEHPNVLTPQRDI